MLEWEERVALYAGGDLRAGAAEVERHMGECSGCQVLWSGVRESLAMLRTAHDELPDAAQFTAVRARVMADLERCARPWRRLAWISGMGAVAAVLLFMALWPARVDPVPVRMLASIPPARPAVAPVPPVRTPAVRQATVRTRQREPITIKLQTSDPNIVIYWLAD